MRLTFARLLALLLVLLVAACEPAPARGPDQPWGPSATTRWFLGIGEPSCLERLDDSQASRGAPRDPSAYQQALGAPGLPDNPRTMLVRIPILNELMAYSKAVDKAQKEGHANALRTHFKSNDPRDGIPASAAKAFREMLLDPTGKDRDDVVVVFRSLKGDPLSAELLGILEAKYAPAVTAPAPSAGAAAASAPSAATATTSPATTPTTLPTFTTEEAFATAHKEIKTAIDEVRGRYSQLSANGQARCDNWFNERADFVQKCLAVAEKMKTAALEATDETEKATRLKAASLAYVGLFYTGLMSQFLAAGHVVTDWNAQQKMEDSKIGNPVRGFLADPDIVALGEAALNASDPVKLGNALVKGVPRLEHYFGELQDFVKLSSNSEALTKKVILVADLLMLAHSLSSMKLPTMSGGGAAGALAIAGTSGGAAVMSAAQLARIAAAVASIQKLIAIGAIQAAPAIAVIAGGHTALASTAGGTPNVPSPASLPAQPADLQPYNKGKGHHVPAKKSFEGAQGYDANKALAIPNAELKRLNIPHEKITAAQLSKYVQFDKTGQPFTWEAVAKIETDALVEAGMKPDMAQATVAKAIKVLKDAGIVLVRVPWGK